MFVIAAVHAGDDDIAVDQRIVEIRAAQSGTRRANPAQFLRAGKQFRRHRPVGRISGLDLGEGVFGIGECLCDSTRDDLLDFLRPRRVGIWG